MKLVTIEIRELPLDYRYPYYETVRLKNPIKVYSFDGMDSTPLPLDKRVEVLRESYAIKEFGYGRDYYQKYYIREKDEKALEEMFHGFIERSKKDLIDSLWHIAIEFDPSESRERLMAAVQELHERYRYGFEDVS